jgi:hypothetical protein
MKLFEKKIEPYRRARLPGMVRDSVEKICQSCPYFSRIELCYPNQPRTENSEFYIYCSFPHKDERLPKGWIRHNMCPSVYGWEHGKLKEELLMLIEKAKNREVYVDMGVNKWIRKT